MIVKIVRWFGYIGLSIFFIYIFSFLLKVTCFYLSISFFLGSTLIILASLFLFILLNEISIFKLIRFSNLSFEIFSIIFYFNILLCSIINLGLFHTRSILSLFNRMLSIFHYIIRWIIFMIWFLDIFLIFSLRAKDLILIHWISF